MTFFGFIRKKSIQKHIDAAVENVSETLGKFHDAEKDKLKAQHEDAIEFLKAQKESEIKEYCRQNGALRDIIARMERDKEDVKQGAIENSRVADNIDRTAKSVLDTVEKLRNDLIQALSGEFEKHWETLGRHWQAAAEIVNDARAQQRKVIK